MPDLNYPGPDTIHRHVLDNGIVLLVYENFAAESVIVEGVLWAGALVESRAQAGLASFTADMLMRGAHSRSFDEIYELLESVGASLGISAGRHTTEFSGSSLVEDLDLVLTLLADALRAPAFPEQQLERVRGENITGLQIRANDTRQMAGLNFRQLLYRDHPYAQSVEGYLETVPGLTRDDLLHFHDSYYGPQRMIVTVVGAINAADAVDRVTAALGDWRNPAQKEIPNAPPAARPLMLLREDAPMPEKSQSDIVMGLPGPPRKALDYLDLRLANTVLGVFGMMGRLGENVREKQGLAYYIHSRLQGGLGPSPWYVSTGVSPENVDRAIESIRDEIRRIQAQPVPADELADSQAFLTGSVPVSLETNSGLAGVITDMELHELGLDYLQRYEELINEITAERVQAAAQKYLSDTQLAIAVAGPPAAEAAVTPG